MSKISLIIPIYNTSKTFENTFNSIKNQSIGFENIELIYVDDCSTDDSKNLIEEKIKLYNNVKYYTTEKNSGFPSKPRNIGIKNASSDYIMFLDQDDVFFEDACETLYNLIINENAEIVSGNYLVNNKSDAALLDWGFVNIKKNEILNISSIDENKELLRLNPSIWTKIYNKKFLIENKILFIEDILIEDVIFVSECLLKANSIIFINKPIVNYLLRINENKSEGSLSIAKNKKVLYALINGIKIFNNMLKEFPQEYHWLAVRHLNYWMTQFVESNLSREEKLEILTYSYELFEDYNRFTRAKPGPQYELIFEKIVNKEFIDAIKISEYQNLLNNQSIKNNFLKEKQYIIISKDFNNLKEKNIFYELSEDLNITVLNIDFSNNENTKKQLLEIIEKNNPSNIKKINFYEYFFNKPEFKLKFKSYEENPSKNIFYEKQLIIEEKFDNYKIINYYHQNANQLSKPQIEDTYLMKQQYVFNNLTLYEAEFINGNIHEEKFFNSDEINYLTVTHEETLTYSIKNQNNKTNINFYSKKDLINYFLSEILLKYSNYVIINFEKDYVNLIEHIRSKTSTCIHYLENDANLSKIDFINERNVRSNDNRYILSHEKNILDEIKNEYNYEKTLQLQINPPEEISAWIECLNKIIIDNKLSIFENIIKLNNYMKLKNNMTHNFNKPDKQRVKLNKMSKEELISEIALLTKDIEQKDMEIIHLKEHIIKLIN